MQCGPGCARLVVRAGSKVFNVVPFAEELALEIGPKLRQQVACDTTEQAGLDSAPHDRDVTARCGVIDIGSRDTRSHAEKI